MSNGLYTKVQELIRGGEFPQEVSNDLILAAVLDNTKHTRQNTEDISENAKNIADNVAEIKIARAADKKWGGLSMGLAALVAFFKAGN